MSGILKNIAKTKILSNISFLESTPDQRDLSVNELSDLIKHKSDYYHINHEEELCWKAQSKAKWLKEGD